MLMSREEKRNPMEIENFSSIKSVQMLREGLKNIKIEDQIENTRKQIERDNKFKNTFKEKVGEISSIEKFLSPTRKKKLDTYNELKHNVIPKKKLIVKQENTSDANQQEIKNKNDQPSQFPGSRTDLIFRSGEKEFLSPLLLLDVNLNKLERERIVVYEGDTPKDVVRRFSLKHGTNN